MRETVRGVARECKTLTRMLACALGLGQWRHAPKRKEMKTSKGSDGMCCSNTLVIDDELDVSGEMTSPHPGAPERWGFCARSSRSSCCMVSNVAVSEEAIVWRMVSASVVGRIGFRCSTMAAKLGRFFGSWLQQRRISVTSTPARRGELMERDMGELASTPEGISGLFLRVTRLITFTSMYGLPFSSRCHGLTPVCSSYDKMPKLYTSDAVV